jgi:hypothetical protein
MKTCSKLDRCRYTIMSFKVLKFTVITVLITDFRLSSQFTVDADSSLQSVHVLEVGSVADVFKVHAASIFRVKTSSMSYC